MNKNINNKIMMSYNQKEIIFTEEIDSILNKGIFLGEFGVKNWAFNFPQIVEVMRILKKRGVYLIGGDIYTKKNGYYEIHNNLNNIKLETAFSSQGYVQEYLLNLFKKHEHSKETFFSVMPIIHNKL